MREATDIKNWFTLILYIMLHILTNKKIEDIRREERQRVAEEFKYQATVFNNGRLINVSMTVFWIGDFFGSLDEGNAPANVRIVSIIGTILRTPRAYAEGVINGHAAVLRRIAGDDKAAARLVEFLEGWQQNFRGNWEVVYLCRELLERKDWDLMRVLEYVDRQIAETKNRFDGFSAEEYILD